MNSTTGLKQGHPTAEAGEGVLADGRSEDTIREQLQRLLRGAVGSSLEAVHVLAEDHYRRVSLHPAGHHVADDVDEPAVRQPSGEGVDFFIAGTVELAEIAADADVDEAGVGPQAADDAALAGLASGERFQDGVADALHHRVHVGFGCVDLLGDEQLAVDHLSTQRGDRVAVAPGILLGLIAVAECRPRVGAVLMEVPVQVGLDERGSVARPHVFEGLGHGRVDGQGVHAVHPPAGDVEARPAR